MVIALSTYQNQIKKVMHEPDWYALKSVIQWPLCAEHCIFDMVFITIRLNKGGHMKLKVTILTSLFAVCVAHAYERYELKPGESYEQADPKRKKGEPTYYTDDGKYAVFLTLQERRTIERILKQRTWSDQDYEIKIDEKFIRQRTGGCGQTTGSSCGDETSCSADAQLFKEVMNDFKGKKVDIVFTALNLRRNL
jgi:hypothetical protein